MIKRLWTRTALTAFILLAQTFPAAAALAPSEFQGEVFDVKKESVTRTFELTEDIQEEAKRWLASISGPAPVVRADPHDGIVVHIPFRPPVPVQQPDFNAIANEVFLFVPKDQKPYLLIFSQENEPRIFAFHYPAETFLRKHNLLK